MSSSKVKFVKGSDVTLLIQIFKKTKGTLDASCSTTLVGEQCYVKDPYSLAGFTGVTGFFEKEDGTALSIVGSLISADLGKMMIQLSDTDTAQLLSGEEQSFEIEFDLGSDKTIVKFEESLEIIDRLFDT